MNCWKALGIAPTSDKFAIKKAYAAKLKHHKPDEDPDGFTIVHRHYKQALKGCDDTQNNRTYKEENIHPVNQLIHEVLNIKTKVKKKTENKLHISLYFKPEWLILNAQISQALASPQTANKKDGWNFLEKSEALLDLEFRVFVSNYVFEALLALKNKHPRKKFTIIRTLDIFFRWSDKRDILEQRFGYANTQHLLGKHIAKKKIKQFTWHRPSAYQSIWKSFCYFLSMIALKLTI